MFLFKKATFLASSFLLLLNACGGGGNDDSLPEPLAEVADEVSKACNTVFGERTTYNESISTAMILDSDGDKHKWSPKLPEEWWPQSSDDLDALFCVGPQEKYVIGTCDYIGGPDITRYGYRMNVRWVIPDSGYNYFEFALLGEMPRACASTESQSTTKLTGSKVAFKDLEGYICHRVTTWTGDGPFPCWGGFLIETHVP